MASNPVLYIFVNETLTSMNVGKAMAHAAHAANQFMKTMESLISIGDFDEDDVEDSIPESYKTWARQADGFGTTIVLDVKSGDNPFRSSSNIMSSLIEECRNDSWNAPYYAEFVTDPTYPFSAPYEYLSLMDENLVSFNRDKFYMPSDIVTATRTAVTAAYVFVDKEITPKDIEGKQMMKQLATYQLR